MSLNHRDMQVLGALHQQEPTSGSTVRQLRTGTGLSDTQIRRTLRYLEHVGMVRTIRQAAPKTVRITTRGDQVAQQAGSWSADPQPAQ